MKVTVMEVATGPVAEAKTQAQDHANRFGAMVRERRKALNMKQEDLALVSGVGRRFVIDLEAGKATCELGLALVVANAVGLRVFDLFGQDHSNNALLPDLPDEGRSS